MVGKEEQRKIIEKHCERKMKIRHKGPDGKFLKIIDNESNREVELLKRLNTKGKWKK